MKRISFVVLVLMALSAGGGYWLARAQAPAVHVAATPDAGSERRVLYWYDPMMPDQHFDKPGKSPFMDMDLSPKYADEKPGSGGVSINPTLTQNLGVRLATVERMTPGATLPAPATVMFNERDVAVVQTRAAGFVDRVYGRASGDVVAEGAPLVDLTVPDWASAQAEWLALRESGDKELARAARDRLLLLGMPEDLVRQLEASGRARQHFTITAPVAGVIQLLDVRAGMTISPGMTVARINGLRTVWLEAAVPEVRGGRLKEGQPVTAQFAAYPEKAITGKITTILPALDAASHTLRVRMELPNPGLRLRPGMFAQVSFGNAAQQPVLMVPTEAVIRTGKRNVVLLANTDGSFSLTEVTLGQESEGNTIILDGLQAGQQVVASGQFLIDSEASLRGVFARMNAAPSMPADDPAATETIEAVGVVESIKPNEVTLSHEPIPALDWPAMTMPFAVEPSVGLSALKQGQRVRFWLEKRGDDLVITRIAAAGGRP